MENKNEGQTQTPNTSLDERTIEESCLNIVVTDSLLSEWDKITYDYLIGKFRETQDSCFFSSSRNYNNRNLLRLEFFKTLNNQELLNKFDLTKEYYILESENRGNTRSLYKYLVKDNNEDSMVVYHLFLRRIDDNWIWDIQNQFIIKRGDWDHLILLLQMKSNNNIASYSYNTDVFSLYKFSSDSIIGYMSYCNVNSEVVNFYQKLISSSSRD